MTSENEAMRPTGQTSQLINFPHTDGIKHTIRHQGLAFHVQLMQAHTLMSTATDAPTQPFQDPVQMILPLRKYECEGYHTRCQCSPPLTVASSLPPSGIKGPITAVPNTPPAINSGTHLP